MQFDVILTDGHELRIISEALKSIYGPMMQLTIKATCKKTQAAIMPVSLLGIDCCMNCGAYLDRDEIEGGMIIALLEKLIQKQADAGTYVTYLETKLRIRLEDQSDDYVEKIVRCLKKHPSLRGDYLLKEAGLY